MAKVQKHIAKPRSSAVRVVAAERAMQIFELKKQGFSFHAIGQSIGISRQAAHAAFWRVMDEVKELTIKDAQTWRTLQLERLEQMHAGLWPRACNGDEDAADACRKILDMEASLLGTYAPTKTAATTPDGEATHHVVEWLMVKPGDK